MSVFDEQGRARLEINRQSFESMPDMPLAVVPDSVAVSDSSALSPK